MNNDIKISIVLPFHNSERFLSDTLKCIVRQTFTDFELILVNDGSKDNSVKVINDFSDKRFRIIESQGKGAVDAYNYGIKNAKASFICIIDHDDLFDNKLLEKEYNLLISDNSISLVSSSYCIIDESDNIINKINVPSEDFDIKEKMKYMCSIVNSGSMIRKEIFSDYGYFKQSYYPAHDYEFYLRVMNNIKFGNIPEYLIQWRAVQTSPSQKLFFMQREKSFYALKKYFYNEAMWNRLKKREFYFNIGRSYYYYKSITASIKYFLFSLFLGYLTLENLLFTFKSIFLWFPIKFYRDRFAKKKFDKSYKYKF